MRTLIHRLTRAAAALVVAAGLTVTAVACDQAAVAYPTPQVYTVTYQNQAYCGYIYSPYEIDMYGVPLTCTRIQFPNAAASTIIAGTLQAVLLGYRETYDPFFSSGYWYDQYYAPLSTRYHVTIVNRQVFTTSAHTFDTRYAGDIKSQSAKATWTGAKTGNYKFPTTNAKAKKTKPLTGATTGARAAAGTSNSHDERPPTKTRTGSTSRTGGSGGKSGTTRSGGSGGRRR